MISIESKTCVAIDEFDKYRINRLRWRIIDAPQEVCIERARYITQSMQKHWHKHPFIRMSHALEHILQNISIHIRNDELIVGCRTSKLKGAPLFPENKSRWIEGDLENFDKRILQRALIKEEEKKELSETILPFWKGKSVEDIFEASLPPDLSEDMDKYIFTMMLEITYGIGHFTMNYSKVLSEGLNGIMQEISNKKDSMPDDDSHLEKKYFYEAMLRCCEAAIHFARRYAERARELAWQEKNTLRANELYTIARICEKVPAYPAENFYEAVQSLYFIHLIAQIESGGNSVSIGRIDQILYPYYNQDIIEGRITPEYAKMLICMLFIKTNEIWNVLEEAFIPGGEGAEGKTTQNVTIGGVDIKGNDATNDLSYLILDAYAEIRTVQPNFSVRFSPLTPKQFILNTIECARSGVLLHFFNDETVIPALVRAGHTLEDARNYALVGCVEPNCQGKCFGSTFAVQFNGIKCLELSLTNGIDNIFGYQSGIKSGDPSSFADFTDVWNAYDAQTSHFMSQMVRGMHILDRTIAQTVPSPFASSMIDGCIENGKDLTAGGAVYNSTGVQLIGFANIVDSLYAIKKAVFEDQKINMKDLVNILMDDWQDTEKKRIYFLKKIPKFGNDIDEVDSIAENVVNHFCDLVTSHTNYRGGIFWPGIFSVGFHISFGAFTGATPEGRNSGDVLGNGLTPTTGNAISGPTAIMNSISKLPLTRIYNGANLNMRFNGRKTSTEQLFHLITAYFSKGGMQVQFNMVNTATLREAQKHPEKYRDLFVRVSGYSAEFVGLSEIAQEEIISRTEFKLSK
jgi:formate C-acetyltransferase